MSGNLYELIAIGARYLFALIMIIIVIRAWKITIVDSRRAASLRRLSPETGVCGEFLVLTGSGKVREGMRYPVIREGLIGSSRKADVRLRDHDVHRSHAFFELTKKGLRLRANGHSKIYNARGESRKELMLGDGAKITIGQIELMLILTEGTVVHEDTEQDPDMFDIPDDSEIFTRRSQSISPESVRPVRPPAETEPQRDPFARPVDEILYGEHDESPVRDESIPHYYIPEPEEPNIPDDMFMENSAETLKPDDDIWGDNEPETPIKIWDDWDERPVKPQVKRKQYDDPFDI